MARAMQKQKLGTQGDDNPDKDSPDRRLTRSSNYFHYYSIFKSKSSTNKYSSYQNQFTYSISFPVTKKKKTEQQEMEAEKALKEAEKVLMEDKKASKQREKKGIIIFSICSHTITKHVFLSFFSALVIILSFISAHKQLAKHLPKTPAGKVVKEGFKFTEQTTSLDFVKGRMTKRKAPPTTEGPG